MFLIEIVFLYDFEEKEVSFYELKRKIMRFVIYERDLEKFIFLVEILFLVMVVEFGKNCLKNVLV